MIEELKRIGETLGITDYTLMKDLVEKIHEKVRKIPSMELEIETLKGIIGSTESLETQGE